MKSGTALDRYLASARSDVDAALDAILPQAEGADQFGSRLFEAMRYSVYSGGKRLRPCISLLINQSLGGRRHVVLPGACALEMVHTYSLIHDDLPAMDNDDMRRGRATCHRAFDEATAILAGDALLTLAFQAIIDGLSSDDAEAGERLPLAERAGIVRILARAAGPLGMVLGQMRDLEAEEQTLPLEKVEAIHATKTAAMIAASFEVGAVSATAEPEIVERLASMGRHVGLAFQIVDDILDVVATTEQLGKTAGKDQAEGKATYPSTIGLEASRREAERQTEAALALVPDDRDFGMLHELVTKMLSRTH